MNQPILHQLFRYALAVARHREDRQELGEIHLLKYAYLADLAHASRNGAALTGVAWRFHHFGPWSQEAWKSIGPALSPLRIEERSFAYSHGATEGEGKRWRIADLSDADAVISRSEKVLPPFALTIVDRRVREFGDDTPALLHFVYLTSPMLRAAPGQELDLRPQPAAEEPTIALPARSAKDDKRSREAMRDLRQRVQARLDSRAAAARPRLAPPPRYDEVYVRGSEWMDSLAGEQLPLGPGELVVDESVWRARDDDDLS